MSTTISTPASLATFTQPHASTSKLPHVSMNTVEGGDGSSAVAAVQGDGVWTYDLRTMRPTSSFTVPPTTTFALPPISFHHKSRGKEKAKAKDEGMDVDGVADNTSVPTNERCTAVFIDKAEGLAKNAKGKVIWIWSGEDATHTSITLEDRVVGFHRISLIDRPILAIHSASSYTVISPDDTLPTQHITLPTKTDVTGDILSTQVLRTSPEYTNVLLVDAGGHWVSFTIEGPSGAIKAVMQKEGNLVEGKRVFKSASISKDGVITAIDTQDRLVSRQMNEGSHAVHSTLNHPSTPTLILSLPSFGKPLAILPALHPTPSILLVVPSATSPALLTSMAVTSSTVNTSITHLALLGQTAPNVLVVGVVLHHGSEDGGRSVVYTCEVTIPEKGIGLNALLGSSARTEEYLSIASTGSSSKEVNGTSEDPKEKIVSEITALLAKGDTKAAATRLDKSLAAGHKDQLSEKNIKKVVQAICSTALPALGKEGASDSKQRGPYAPGMITSLLERRLVNDEMIKGGVVAAGLLPLEDWDNIFVALPLLRTIPASALISLIKATLGSTTSKTPITETVLKAILALPSPAPTYRLELKRGLTVEEATSVLEVLVDFAEGWVSQNAKGIEWDTTSTPASSSEATLSLPSLDSVITHSSHLLDSHTPLFLGHPPSYPLLTRMQAALEPLLHMQADYRALRAPLDAVLTLSKRDERDREEKQKKNTLLNGAYAKKGGVRSATSMAQGKRGEGMGDAKVGKWQVEDFAF